MVWRNGMDSAVLWFCIRLEHRGSTAGREMRGKTRRGTAETQMREHGFSMKRENVYWLAEVLQYDETPALPTSLTLALTSK